jgi:hypothetical protein
MKSRRTSSPSAHWSRTWGSARANRDGSWQPRAHGLVAVGSGGNNLEDFKVWLLRSRHLTRDGTEKGAPFEHGVAHALDLAAETLS